jgi:DNA polymerase (family X)
MTSSYTFSNKVIVKLFRNIAAAYMLKNENRFKIIAYQKASDVIEQMTREIEDLWKENKLHGIPGIGPSIRAHLVDLFETGHSINIEEALEGIPSTVFLLMDIPSIGPKKAFKLVQAFLLFDDETVIQDLKKAAQEHKIAKLPTFGDRSEAEILEAIELYQRKDRREERMPLPYAFALAQEIITYMKQLPAVKRIDALGSLRRMVSTIGDIDLAVVADEQDSQAVIDHFLQYPGKIAIDNAGEKKASIIAVSNIRVDLRVTEAKTYGSMLQYFTGSKAHNINLREYALRKGYSLSEYGIKDMSTNMISTFAQENDFYHYLNLQCVPPELREGTKEIELAAKNKLPNLIALPDIKGDFHIHSSYNLQPSHDLGADDYLTLVDKAKQLGYSYLGFTDHNPKNSGLSELEIGEIMKERKNVISMLKLPIPCFIGLEVDILPSGDLALPQSAIDYVDYLIVSIHSVFKMPQQQMTDRVLKALSYPKVKVLGHPTGRLLGKRDSIDVDWEAVFSLLKEKNIAIEINSCPERLDLPDGMVKEAKEKGAIFIINSDAHAVSQMDNMFYGVSVARRGWLTAPEVVNSWGIERIKEWMKI